MTQKDACNLLMEKGIYYVCSMITVMLKKDKPNLFIGGSIGLWKKEKTNPVYSQGVVLD